MANPFVDRPIENPFVAASPQAQQPAPAVSSAQQSADYEQIRPGSENRRTFIGKTADLIGSIGAPSPAKAANIVALSEQTGLTPTDTQKNYDEITKELGLRQTPNTMEMADFAMKLYGGVGGAAPLVKGLLSYAAAQKLEQNVILPGIVMIGQKLKGEEVKYEVTKLRDLVPDKFGTLADIAELYVNGKAAAKVSGLGAKMKEAMNYRDGIVATLTGQPPKTPGAPLTKEQFSPRLGEYGTLSGVSQNLSSGMKVRAADRGNIGTVVDYSGGDTAVVSFFNKKTGLSATTTLPVSQLTTISGKKIPIGIPPSQVQLQPANLGVETPQQPQDKPEMAGNLNMKNITVPEVKETLVKLAEENPSEFTTQKVTMKQMRENMNDPNTMQALSERLNEQEGTGGSVAFKSRQELVDSVIQRKAQLDAGDKEGLKSVLGYVSNLRKIAAEAGRTLGTFTQKVPDDATAFEIVKGLKSKYGNDPEFMAGLRDIEGALANKEVLPPTLSDKIYEVFLNSILYSPETQARNIIGNTVMLLGAFPEKAAAATADFLWSFGKGQPRTTYFREIPAMAKGLVKGLAGKGDVQVVAGEKFSMGEGAISGVKGEVMRAPTALLSKMDNVNKQLAGMMEKYATSVKEAKMEGLTGEAYKARVAELRAKPSEAGQARIESEQLYRTFQKEADSLAKLIMKSREVFPPAKYIYPFVKTPANIFKAAAERTPLGAVAILKRAGFLGEKFATEGYGREQIMGDIGKMVVGSTVSAYFLNQWSQGRVTGNAPTDRRQRDRFYDQGFMPNSAKIAGQWVPLSNFEPLGTAIALTVNTAQAYAESDKEVPQDKLADIIKAWGYTLTHAPYMDGARRLFEALENPAGKIGEMVGQIVSGMVPFSGALKFATKQIDPTLREPNRDSFLAGIRDKVYSEIPGLNKMVRPKLTVFGEEIQSPRSTLMKGTEKRDKLNDEIERLGVKIDYVPKKIGQFELDKDTQESISRLMGPKMKEAMEKIVSKPNWDKIEPASQRRILETVERKYRNVFINTLGKRRAIRQIMDSTPEGGDRAEQLIKVLKPDILFKGKEIRRDYYWNR
jgi:hypothetical protein